MLPFLFHTLFPGLGNELMNSGINVEMPDIKLSELYYSFDIAKVLFVKTGNQLLAWGPSQIWPPVDFVNSEKASSLSSIDIRSGKPGLRAHLLLPFGNLFAFFDFSQLFVGTADPVNDISVALRFDTTAAGFEFGANVYGGGDTRLRFGLDATGRLFGMRVYSEVSWAPASDESADTILASLGFSRSLGDRNLTTVSFEGFFNSEGNDYTAKGQIEAIQEELVPLYQGKFFAWASLQQKELFSKYLTTSLSGLVNMSDRSFLIRLSENLAFPRSVPVTAEIAVSGGGYNKEFTRASGPSTITFRLFSRIEF